jgi:protein-L-isoaspartate(D-aspartate) O-methyltransferase
MTINFEQARHNMVEQQVRPWEVLDARVLELFARIQREDFVPVRYRKMAFADLSIPLDHGEFMMKPVVEGRMLQAVDIQPGETVLEIGTGSGFITACLAHLASHVVSVDIHESFTHEASRRLGEHGIENAELHSGDVMRGWQPEQAQDVVVVTGSVPSIPEAFQGWVNPGGRLFCITGQSPAMEAVLLTRLNATEWRRDSLFETDIPALVNSVQAAEFEF